MSELMGHLVWWKVTNGVDMDFDQLTALLAGTGIDPPNHRPVPIDVFRRVSGLTRTYPLEGDDTLELMLAKVESKVTSMMSRHMVATVRNGAGVVQVVRKVGDVAFYKPPRRQHSKARLRVIAGGGPHAEHAQDFAQYVRAEYDRGVKGAVDSQAIRRLIRTHLATHGAVYLDGPYFIENEEQCAGLESLFSALGEGSFMHVVPLLDTPKQREFVTRHAGAEEVIA